MFVNDYCQVREEDVKAFREVEKERSKIAIREESRLYILDQSIKKRQEAEEFNRSIFEKMEVDADGKIVVTTQSQSRQFQPREISDMRNPPQFYIAGRASNLSEQVFILDCQLAGTNKVIYFSPKRIRSGTYVLGQLAAAGITIYAPSSAKAKVYAQNLIALLVKSGFPTVIPDEPGWMELDDENFSFVEEDRMTWEKIVKLI